MTRPDRVLYPESGFTKADAVRYYRAVAKWLLPHLKGRPVSFQRYPDTVRGESFWEKDAPSFTPPWVKTFGVPRRSGESEIHYIVVNDVKTLAWAADVGAIELHPFLHRLPHVERATSVVFDLDPGEGAGLVECCEVALILREALGGIDLDAFAKVSGSKGLQVYVPLNGEATHDATEVFAKAVAEELARQHPKRIVAKMTKALRARKVFIDWSQNADYKTTVSVYSLRAKRETPYVSMPVTWEEVEAADVDALTFTPDDAIRRLKRKGDLFAPVLKRKQSIPEVRGTRASRTRASEEEAGAIVHGIRLPRPKSQSGRRLFVITKAETGNELWLDMHGRFKRWILRPDREGGEQLIAMPAGDIPIHPDYFRGVVPDAWKDRLSLEDAGSYELIDGSYQRRRFDLWFTGRVLAGEWLLEKVSEDEAHRSWSLAPVRTTR